VSRPGEASPDGTETIFDAVKKAGVRALVSAGWGGLGGTTIPDEVFILEGNIPHDWLFADDRVTAVCHHGGEFQTHNLILILQALEPQLLACVKDDQRSWYPSSAIKSASASSIET
jgi:sterol 3beta-glucosyltransferase